VTVEVQIPSELFDGDGYDEEDFSTIVAMAVERDLSDGLHELVKMTRRASECDPPAVG
jgi:hypothetical protein